MGVLDVFLSTWSDARSTFGQGAPQDGAAFDGSSTLRRLEGRVAAAAPGSRWTGTAATAYGAVNTEHGRVLGALADLDRRLREQVDQSAHLVSSGRESLETIRTWVTDAVAGIPRNAAGERMLLPIVQKGLAEVIDTVTRSNSDLNAIGEKIRVLGEEYRALGNQKFGGGEPGDGLSEPPSGYYKEWRDNAERQGVPPETLVDIAQRHNVTPDSFNVLDKMEKVTDKEGKSFFLMPPETSGEDARKAALMTYILNAGTDYGDTDYGGTDHDFDPTPYSADEVQRIINRQVANSWSYDRDVDFVHGNGGRLMTTPNGMLMGLGGNQLQDFYSAGGGSTWGDVFMVNIDDPADPAQTLRDMTKSGVMWYPTEGGEGAEGRNQLDLDRILHHEEIHSQQWERKGYLGFIDAYLTGKVVEIFTDHPMEKEAGLSDGGYE